MNNRILKITTIGSLLLLLANCGVPDVVKKEANPDLPNTYKVLSDSLVGPLQYAEVQKTVVQDSTNAGNIKWNAFFKDPYLVQLIDSALSRNQELNITLQEIKISRNEIQSRKGEYLPFVDIGADAGLEKTPRFTRNGAVEENLDVKEDREFPDPLGDFQIGAHAKWEVDIWNKLHNAKKAAVYKYFASIEGKNYMVTNLIAEIAHSYYELTALDKQLNIVQKNIDIQTDALHIMKLRKQTAQVNSLAVKRFKAQVLRTKSLRYKIRQQIVQTENELNYLVGQYPQHIERSSDSLGSSLPDTLRAGVPAQLLKNRPDVKRAEFNIEAAKLNVMVARKRFYPSLDITANIGYRAFDPEFLLNSPESLLYSIAGGLTAPLINRNAIKAAYKNANATQIQAVYKYEQTLLDAYREVANQVARISNLSKSYSLEKQRVKALSESVDISNNLFRSARADYMEVLLTQREALNSKFELIETKIKQMNAKIALYQALGGGWSHEDVPELTQY